MELSRFERLEAEIIKATSAPQILELEQICSFQAAFLLRGAGSEPGDRNNGGGSE